MKKIFPTLLFLCSFTLLGHLSAGEGDKQQKRQTQSVQYLSIKQSKKEVKWKKVASLLIGVSITGFISVVAMLAWKIIFIYPPMDSAKTYKIFYLYKIEQEGKPTSYLHGTLHLKSSEYVLPEIIKQLPIDRLVTENDYHNDQDLKVWSNTLFNKILEKYSESQHALLTPYIEQIEAYKNADELQFLQTLPWLSIKCEGKGQYTEKVFHDFFKEQEKSGLETFSENMALTGYYNLDYQKLGEGTANQIWWDLENYALRKKTREIRLKEADTYDERISATDNPKEKLSWYTLCHKFYQRNQLWWPRMERMMQDKRNLIVVESGHVNDLLLRLLRKGRKYKITRILEDGKEEAVLHKNYNKPFT